MARGHEDRQARTSLGQGTMSRARVSSSISGPRSWSRFLFRATHTFSRSRASWARRPFSWFLVLLPFSWTWSCSFSCFLLPGPSRGPASCSCFVEPHLFPGPAPVSRARASGRDAFFQTTTLCIDRFVCLLLMLFVICLLANEPAFSTHEQGPRALGPGCSCFYMLCDVILYYTKSRYGMLYQILYHTILFYRSCFQGALGP